MRRSILAAVAAFAVTQASAQTLHIGLRQDPDLLDPTLGSSYVGRIVFSGICDKLFDIDEKLNIVPVLGKFMGWSQGVMPADFYTMVFTMHATVMIFFEIGRAHV